jgi:hypothetical protein
MLKLLEKKGTVTVGFSLPAIKSGFSGYKQCVSDDDFLAVGKI